jgi:carbon-monoxide dehydrogenase large subunit
MLAMKSKRPVKLEMSREESFLHGNPRSPAIIYIKDGYKKDGTLMDREIREIINGGAYNGHVSVLVNDGAYGATGTYKVPHMNLDAYGVYTNTPATGPYRALGSELLTFAMECQFERVADQLGIDKYEIRRKNLLRDGDIDPNGQIVYNNSTIQALDKVVEFIQWGKPVPQLEKPWVVGRGISVGNKYTMSGSASVAISKIHDDGVIEIRHYQIELGQGCNTILAQVAAEEFNVPAEKIKIVFDDSAFCPFDHGTFCSRGTFMNGNAVRLACQDVKKKLFARAAEEMGVPADKLDTKNSMIFEKTNPDNAIPFGKLFNYGGWTLGSGELIGSAAYYYPLGKMDPETGQGNPVAYYSYGALGMDVAVNTETGEIRLLKVCGWYDPGQILNRGNIDGQIHGAFSMGVGQALFEEMKFNDEGKCINPNFRDYRIPTMLDIPYKDITTVGYVGEPHKEGPYGAKGIGEVSLVPVMPVVANAINNALGVQINDLPITRERVLFAIKEKG